MNCRLAARLSHLGTLLGKTSQVLDGARPIAASFSGSPALDGKLCSGDKGSGIGSQAWRGNCDIFDPAQMPKRDARASCGLMAGLARY